MHKLNVLLARKELAIARLLVASDNIAHAKEAVGLAVINHGAFSRVWQMHNESLVRHHNEWQEAREVLRELDWELGNK